MSEFKITKTDGSSTTFNFKFDNGLPVKPIINPQYQEMYSKSEDLYILYIYLKDEDVNKLGDMYLSGYQIDNHEEKNELWLFIKDVYIVLGKISDKIVEELKNKKLGFCFFTQEKTFIKGVQLE